MTPDNPRSIEAVFFDYGGVLAHEGFLPILQRAAAREGIGEKAVIEGAVEALFESGYLVGRSDAETFWREAQRRTGLDIPVHEVKAQILAGYRLRPRMLAYADALRAMGVKAAILSDHMDWLDELEVRDDFFKHFDRVFNSFHEGVTKREPESFTRALAAMEIADPGRALFIDDARRNVALAQSLGIHAILCEEYEDFEKEFLSYFPSLRDLP